MIIGIFFSLRSFYNFCLICISAILLFFSLFQSKVALWAVSSKKGICNKILYFILFWLLINIFLITCSCILLFNKITYKSQWHSWQIVRDYMYYLKRIYLENLKLKHIKRLKKINLYSHRIMQTYINNKSGVLLDHNNIEMLEILLRITKDDLKNYKILYNAFKHKAMFILEALNSFCVEIFPGTNIFKCKHDILLLLANANQNLLNIATKENNYFIIFESKYLDYLIYVVRNMEINEKNESIKIDRLLNQVNKVGVMIYSMHITKRTTA